MTINILYFIMGILYFLLGIKENKIERKLYFSCSFLWFFIGMLRITS